MLTPFIAVYVLFVLAPIVFGVVLSFATWNGIGPITFVGADNYARLVADPHVQRAFVNLLYFVGLDVPIGMALGLGLALFVGRFRGRGATVIRAILFLPFVMPLFLTAAIWEWMLVPHFGLFTQGTAFLGLGGVDWLNDPAYMVPALVIVEQWHSAGFNMLLFYAALKAIPESTLEAAKLDGANVWQEVWHIQLPQLRPVLFIVTVNALISTFQVFDLPWLLSKSGFIQGQGGAAGGLLFPVMQAVATGLGTLRLGSAAAIGTLLLLLILVVTAVAFGGRALAGRRHV
jgi:multiple sugar transport system permease protein